MGVVAGPFVTSQRDDSQAGVNPRLHGTVQTRDKTVTLQTHSLAHIVAVCDPPTSAGSAQVLPHLRLAVGGDGGQQVQHGQHGPRMDDHHVGRRRGRGGGGCRVRGVGQVELQVCQSFDRSGRA